MALPDSNKAPSSKKKHQSTLDLIDLLGDLTSACSWLLQSRTIYSTSAICPQCRSRQSGTPETLHDDCEAANREVELLCEKTISAVLRGGCKPLDNAREEEAKVLLLQAIDYVRGVARSTPSEVEVLPPNLWVLKSVPHYFSRIQGKLEIAVGMPMKKLDVGDDPPNPAVWAPATWFLQDISGKLRQAAGRGTIDSTTAEDDTKYYRIFQVAARYPDLMPPPEQVAARTATVPNDGIRGKV